MRLLQVFVAVRFWVAPTFLLLFYLQVWMRNLAASATVKPLLNAIANSACIVLLATLVLAILANLLWAADYKSRLVSGVNRLRSEPMAEYDSAAALSQMNWANARLIGVVTMILAVMGQFLNFEKVPPLHGVPALVIGALIMTSLFDSALDLEAEWTMCAIVGSQSHKQSPGPVSLPDIIWRTNQYRVGQQALCRMAFTNEDPSGMSYDCFTGTAKNLISFAVIIVSSQCAAAAFLLFRFIHFS
jgi:hypothetical protein